MTIRQYKDDHHLKHLLELNALIHITIQPVLKGHFSSVIYLIHECFVCFVAICLTLLLN